MTRTSSDTATAAARSFTDAVVSVNGRISGAQDAAISVFDHGFLYGEGVYETLRTYDAEPFLFDRHMRRLRRSAQMMALPVTASDADMLARVRETMAAHDRALVQSERPPAADAEKYIRILLTRGVGELSYRLDACPAPTLVIIVKSLEVPPDRTFTEGIRVALVGIRRNHPAALNPMIKSNNLLNLALAMQEAYARGADEALMQNQAGELVECSQSNFFVVRAGRVLTAPLSAGLLPGITREVVLELAAEEGVPAEETRLVPEDLQTAGEAFLTGTTREVTPIVAVDDRPIGSGRPGPITLRLLEAFRRRIPRQADRRT
jgi:branched-chain amino acid aminotransferase